MIEHIPPYLLPILVFCLKFIELTLDAIRIICISKGYKQGAFFISFLQCAIWLMALSIVITNLNNLFNAFFYALGMATGSLTGIMIEKKLALGQVIVRVITQKNAQELLKNLRNVGFRVTDVNAQSNFAKVKIFFIPIKNKSLPQLIKIIKEYNPKAFYTVEEIKTASLSLQNPDSHLVREVIKNWRKKNSQSL